MPGKSGQLRFARCIPECRASSSHRGRSSRAGAIPPVRLTMTPIARSAHLDLQRRLMFLLWGLGGARLPNLVAFGGVAIAGVMLVRQARFAAAKPARGRVSAGARLLSDHQTVGARLPRRGGFDAGTEGFPDFAQFGPGFLTPIVVLGAT